MSKSKFMVDYRCPTCNQPVKGDHEVVHLKRLPKVDACPHCETEIILEQQEDGDLGPVHFFRVVKPIIIPPKLVKKGLKKLIEKSNAAEIAREAEYQAGAAAKPKIEETTPAGAAIKKFSKVEAPKATLDQTGQAIVLAQLAEDLGMHVPDVATFPKRLKEAGLPEKMDRWVIDLAHRLNRNAIDAMLFRNNRPLLEKAPELTWTEAKAEVAPTLKAAPVASAAKTTTKAAPAERKVGKPRHAIFGHAATKVVMWLGKNGYGAESAKKFLAHMGVESTPASIATFIRSGIKGDRGPIIELTKEQAAEVKKILK